jgi:fatty acid synthase subunit alpha, fungi type
LDQKNDTILAEATPEASLYLMTSFAEHIVENLKGCNARIAILRSVILAISTQHLFSEDIHTVASSFEPNTRLSVLSAFYRSLAALEQAGEKELPPSHPSSLIQAAAIGNASIYALFGGQGTNEVYFDELRALYRSYKSYVGPFLAEISREVLEPLASSSSIHRHTYYAYGLDVIGWLEDPQATPSLNYLASIPISFPLIGLTQLVQYLASCRILNCTPGQMREHLAGATGHSQGIVSAVVASASCIFEEYVENSKCAVKWLFYSGLRGQEAFPTLDVSPNIVKDSLEGGEGTPSPMLSVTGLLQEELAIYINKTNQYLSDNSKLQVSLHNGPRAFVVTGPPKALFGLVVNLRKIRAPPGLDQSKVPFSKRKAVFSVRFLVVGVPYHHSAFLSEAISKVCEIDLGGIDLFSKEAMAIPVFNTEDGE